MKCAGVLRLLISALVTLTLLSGQQALASAGTPSPAHAAAAADGASPMHMVDGRTDCCPGKHKAVPPACPKCPLMAICSSPGIAEARTAELSPRTYSLVARSAPIDEGERADHRPPPLQEPPRSQG